MLGGELQSYLPQKKQIILAGCFNQEHNPDCPNIVLAGNAPKVERKAKLLVSQPNTIFPVFTKKRKKDKFYQFSGYFRCTSGSNDAQIIKMQEEHSGREGGLSYVLYLTKCEVP
ncbi:hypothetical protein [Pectobacterium atrosepticum]|uniref:hypothetical protein n=1 Tax=Pectobacterium atrosepticum TaxID=29471 RepID=UPI0012BBC9E1|nr:hypothetical protein [Pectobacterium atrosepticum]